MICCNPSIVRMTGLHIMSEIVQCKCKNQRYFNIIPMCRNFSNLTFVILTKTIAYK